MDGVCSLRTEYAHNPLGIDVLRPRFSWEINASSRCTRQEAYQIVVASSEENLSVDNGDMWDSGKVLSDASNQVLYSGSELDSGAAYYWKVRVWDNNGGQSAWSHTAKWTMGLLKRSEWQGKWIGLNTAQMTDHSLSDSNPCPYLRKEWNIAKPIRRAYAYATALGLYELFINGRRVGDDVLNPGWTDYRVRLQYQTYDVTPLLVAGDNAIGAIVGDGWYCGHIGLYGYRQYGRSPRFLLQLNIEYEDGSLQSIVTDESWKANTGPLLGSDLIMGEVYDASGEHTGWTSAGFDDREWRTPDLYRDYQAWLVSQWDCKVKVTETLRPISVMGGQHGTYVVDMGQNMVGRIALTIRGIAKTRITLRYGEMLNEDGTLYTSNLRGAKQTDLYLPKGAELEQYRSYFTVHGFRYVEVDGYPGVLTAGDITGEVIHSEMPETGWLETSNPMVNQLISNIRWTQRANFLSVPTDCPQRDERLGWAGDAQLFSRTAGYNAEVYSFFAKWLNDMSDAQLPTGAFTDTAPFLGHLSDVYPLVASAGWADAGIIIPWNLYLVYGDTELIRKHYDSMCRFIDYIYMMNPELIRTDTQLFGDWLSIGADTPMNVYATAYFAYSADLLSRIAERIGCGSDAKKYSELSQKIKNAYVEAFVEADGRIHGETQTCYALALAMDLLPEDMRSLAARHLAQDIEQRGFHISTGIQGIKYLLPVLSDFGYDELAYRLLLQDTYPSWNYSIKHGATTIWERWDGWTEEKGFQDPMMNSFNHYALGSVGEWLFGYMAGIQPDPQSPGYKNVFIRPRIGGNLAFVNCRYRSMYGMIECNWKRSEEQLQLDITIPANSSAIIYIPAASQESVYEAGMPLRSVQGIESVYYADGTAVVAVGSGSFTFQSKM